MGLRDDLVAELHRLVGIGEDPPGSNCCSITADFAYGCVPWCGLTQEEAAKKIGHELSISNPAYCPTRVAWYRAQDWWIGRDDYVSLTDFVAAAIAQVQGGDEWFFDEAPGTADSDAWHVGGVVVSPTGGPAGASLQTVEGNWGNACVLNTRPIDVSCYGFGLRRDLDDVTAPQPDHQPDPIVVPTPTPADPPPAFPIPAEPWVFPDGFLIRLTSPYMGSSPSFTTANPFDVHDTVARAQQVLRDRGYTNPDGSTLADDGEYGPWTEANVLAFQERHPHLEVDGILGPDSYAALFSEPLVSA